MACTFTKKVTPSQVFLKEFDHRFISKHLFYRTRFSDCYEIVLEI